MKKLSISCIFLSFFLILATLLSSCTLFPTFNLETFQYTEFNFEELEKVIDDCDIIVSKYSNLTDEDIKSFDGEQKLNIISKALVSMNTSFNEFADTLAISKLRYDQDTTSSYYKNEYYENIEKYSSLYAKYIDVHYKAVCLPCAMALFNDKEYIEKTKKQHSISSKENYASLSSEMNDIGNEYIENYYNSMNTNELYAHKEDIAQILLNLAKKGKEFAVEIGCDSYADYAYEFIFQRQFSPTDAKTISNFVKQYISPLYNNSFNNTGKESFLKSSESVLNALTKIGEIDENYYYLYNDKKLTDIYDTYFNNYFSEISSTAIGAYNKLKANHLYITTGAKSLTPTFYTLSYSNKLHYYNQSFIYQSYSLNKENALNNISDFIHEMGHTYAYYANSPNVSNYDICEIHSQAGELLFKPYYEKMFNKETSDYFINNSLFLTSYYSIIMGCYMDELQQYVYNNCETLTASDIVSYSTTLAAEYNVNSNFWTIIPHTFENPFYYISYAVSAIPALQIYERSLTNRQEAINIYNSTITEDKPFEDLLTSAGLSSPLEEQTYISLKNLLSPVFV